MRVAWRVAVVLVVFIGIGVLVEHVVMMHGVTAGTGPAVVRPTAWAAGLFAGGGAAAIAAVAVFFFRGER